MASNEGLADIEDAAARFRALMTRPAVANLHAVNEATTRLLVVDEILALLGWPKEEFHPERPTSNGGYTDYCLTIDGQPRLIVEAKRIGLFPTLPKSIQRPQYNNAFLANNCGQELQLLLNQCKNYCAETGTSFAVATTGTIWIVLVGYRTGVEWGKMRAFVFHSFDDIHARFSEFYGLLSRQAVQQNSLEERFSPMVLVKPAHAVRPYDLVADPEPVEGVPDRRAIESYFELFMDELVGTQQRHMLQQCYVQNRQLNEFSRDLKRLLEYDAALDELPERIESTDEERLHDEIDLQFAAGRACSILLVGNVGAGKSTFVHRFIQLERQPKDSVCVVVDVINEANVRVDNDRAEEQHLAGVVLERLAEEFGALLDPHAPAVLRGCFERELLRFKNQRQQLSRLNPDEFMLREEEHLTALTQDKYKHLVGYLQYARKKRYKAWVVFDNVDRGSDTYQAFVYGFAHRLASAARCITLITMRADTYIEAERGGFLDVRGSDVVFKISAPEFRQVVSKRRKYVEWLMGKNKLPMFLRPNLVAVKLLNAHINRLVVAENGKVRGLISAFSNNNVRGALGMLREYYTSSHSTFNDFYLKWRDASNEPTFSLEHDQEYARFIQSLMLDDVWRYQGDRVFNVFSVARDEKSSHFLILAVLGYFTLERGGGRQRLAIKAEKVCSDLVFLGFQRHHIEGAIRRLVDQGLLVAPRLPVDGSRRGVMDGSLAKDLKLVLSPMGYFYFHELVGHPYYLARAGEDTTWYDKEAAERYAHWLQESLNSQAEFGREDALPATDAYSIFVQYLKRSLLEESQDSVTRTTSVEWARLLRDKIERTVFGHPLTQSAFVPEAEAASTERQAGQPNATTTGTSSLRGRLDRPENEGVQLPLFGNAASIDEAEALKQAAASLCPLPVDLRYQNSAYVIRVLWALEIASRAGLKAIRSADVARIIREVGRVDVEPTNVAKFLREQRRKGEHAYLWKEAPDGFFSISSSGRDLLLTLVKPRSKRRVKRESTRVDSALV